MVGWSGRFSRPARKYRQGSMEIPGFKGNPGFQGDSSRESKAKHIYKT